MLIIKKSIYITVILITIISCSKTGNKEEIEPNNTFSTATEINLNSEYTGLLDSENDIDNFILKIEEEQVIHLELSAIKGINHAIHIHRLDDSKPQMLKVIDDSRKSSPEEYSNHFVYPGIYIITVTHGSGDARKGNNENRYSLKITSRSFYNEEKEPNDTPQKANPINNGDTLTGYYSPSRNSLNENAQFPYREEDWYRAEIITGEENPVTIDLTLSGVAGVDAVLSIYDPDMKEIITSDNASSGSAESISGIGIRTSGTYYICVTAKSFQYNHMEPYNLSLKLSMHDSRNELEPNNSFESANKMTGNEISGRINQSGDQDFFIYSGADNTNVRIRLLNDEGVDTAIAVYDNEKGRVIEVNNTGAGYEEIIPAIHIDDLIYIKVTSRTFASADLFYKLLVEPLYIAGVSEREPNNDLKEANPVENEITGFTSHKTDRDCYIVKTPERLKFKIMVESPKHGTIKISTTDQMGYVIKTRSAGNGTTVQMIEMFDRKGYIFIETVVPDYENPYKIKIEETR